MHEAIQSFQPLWIADNRALDNSDYDQAYYCGQKKKDGVQFPLNGSFLDPESHYQRKAKDMLELLDLEDQSGLVLDAGSGPGHLAYWATKLKLSYSVVSCDISPFVLSYAKEHSLTTQADVNELPFADNSFIGIIFSDVLEHVSSDDALRIVARAHRMLKDSGRLLLNIPNARTWSSAAHKDPYHLWLPTIEEAKELLQKAGFNRELHFHTRGFPLSSVYRVFMGRDLRLPILGRSIQVVVEK